MNVLDYQLPYTRRRPARMVPFSFDRQRAKAAFENRPSSSAEVSIQAEYLNSLTGTVLAPVQR